MSGRTRARSRARVPVAGSMRRGRAPLEDDALGTAPASSGRHGLRAAPRREPVPRTASATAPGLCEDGRAWGEARAPGSWCRRSSAELRPTADRRHGLELMALRQTHVQSSTIRRSQALRGTILYLAIRYLAIRPARVCLSASPNPCYYRRLEGKLAETRIGSRPSGTNSAPPTPPFVSPGCWEKGDGVAGGVLDLRAKRPLGPAISCRCRC